MKGPDVKNLKMFRALCEDGLEGVTLVTTKWNTMADRMALAERRESELLSEHYGSMMRMGATYARDDGTPESSRHIIAEVLKKNKEFHLPFQWEIMDEGKTLDEIEAGRILMKELHDERARHREELEELKASLITEHSEEMRKTMAEDAAKLERLLRDGEADRVRLAKKQAEEMKRMEKETARRLEQLRKQNAETIERLGKKHTEDLLKQQKIIEQIQEREKEGDSSLLWTVVSWFCCFVCLLSCLWAGYARLLGFFSLQNPPVHNNTGLVLTTSPGEV